MANVLFDLGRQGILDESIGWNSGIIKDILVDHATDTPLPATDNALSDILAGARVATSPAYASKTSTNGVADAADVIHTAVSGATIESIVIYQDTGVETTSRLIAFIDTVTPAFPLTPNGGDITIQWDPGANRIFKL